MQFNGHSIAARTLVRVLYNGQFYDLTIHSLHSSECFPVFIITNWPQQEDKQNRDYKQTMILSCARKSRCKFVRHFYYDLFDRLPDGTILILIELETHLPGGNLLLSISIATTFTISTQIGQSKISFSDLTNATSDRH